MIAVAAASAAWLGLLVAAPSLSPPLVAVTYAAASFVCHQIPERSFYRGVAQLPVCARCLGIYAGLAAGALAWCVVDAAGRRTPRIAIRRVLLLTALPTALTVVLESTGLWAGSNALRAVSGAVLGLGLACALAWAVSTISYERWRPWGPLPPDPR
jgi:uncharacterized membrane protein